MDLDKQLRETEIPRGQNWGKLLANSKKQFEEWVTGRLFAGGHNQFKFTYMPVFMNIPLEGVNNNELAAKVRVTKQAMSKVVKELQDMGYIKSKVSPHDKRNSIVSLTEKGKKMVLECRSAMTELMNEYRAAIGKKNFDTMMSTLQEIIDYNDQKKASQK
jgi:DNA-binding MarR family transcriptional regulator